MTNLTSPGFVIDFHVCIGLQHERVAHDCFASGIMPFPMPYLLALLQIFLRTEAAAMACCSRLLCTQTHYVSHIVSHTVLRIVILMLHIVAHYNITHN